MSFFELFGHQIPFRCLFHIPCPDCVVQRLSTILGIRRDSLRCPRCQSSVLFSWEFKVALSNIFGPGCVGWGEIFARSMNRTPSGDVVRPPPWLQKRSRVIVYAFCATMLLIGPCAAFHRLAAKVLCQAYLVPWTKQAASKQPACSKQAVGKRQASGKQDFW